MCQHSSRASAAAGLGFRNAKILELSSALRPNYRAASTSITLSALGHAALKRGLGARALISGPVVFRGASSPSHERIMMDFGLVAN
jgi:hypothetical protein